MSRLFTLLSMIPQQVETVTLLIDFTVIAHNGYAVYLWIRAQDWGELETALAHCAKLQKAEIICLSEGHPMPVGTHEEVQHAMAKVVSSSFRRLSRCVQRVCCAGPEDLRYL